MNLSKKSILIYLYVVLVGITFVGCKDDDETTSFSIGTKRLTFTESESSQEVSIYSSDKWSTSVADSWVSISPSSSKEQSVTATVTVKKNTGLEARSSYIAVRSDAGKDTIRILQTGAKPMIALSQTTASVTYSGKTLNIIVASNVGDWAVTSDDGWIVLPTIASGANYCSLKVVTNSYTKRVGTVRFQSKTYSNVYTDLVITQDEGINLERGADSTTLVNFYNTMDGDHWKKKWKLSDPMTSWNGVTLTGQRVSSLSLNNNNLKGEISGDIVNLTNLKVISFIDNQLSGSIPSNIAKLGLEELYLSGNQYTGNIPSVITTIPSLKKLDLSSNQFSGNIIDFSPLSNLEYLILDENSLSGNIPSSIGNLGKLQYLYLNNNGLSGSIPVSIGNLKSLIELKLFTNGLTGNIPNELGNLTNLVDLELQENTLSGEIPSSLGKLTKLTNLLLHQNQLSGEIPSDLGGLSGLVNFSIEKNQLSGKIPSTLGNLSNLQNFVAGYNKFSGEIPATLGNLTKLFTLGLSSNDLSGSIPASIGNITTLKYLYLDGNELSGSIPQSLLNHANWKTFDVCNQQPGYGFDNCK